MPFNLPQPSTLDDVFSANPGAFFQAQQQLQGGMDQGQADLQKTQLQNLFDQQNNPQLLQHQGLMNQEAGARIPGIQAQSDITGMNRDAQQANLPDAIGLAKKKYASEASDLDLKQLEDHAQQLAMSSDPNERAQGEELLMHHKDIIRDRAKQQAMQERAIQLENVKGKNALELAGVNNAAGRYRTKAAGPGSPEEAFMDPKAGNEKRSSLAQAISYKAQMDAQQLPEGEEKTALLQKAKLWTQIADDYNQKYIAGRQAGVVAGQEGKPNLGKMGVEVNPQVPVQGFGSLPNTTPGGADRIRQLLPADAQFNSPEVEARVRAAAGLSQPTSMPSGLPQGTKNNGDGTYTLPDGRKVRPKQ